MCLAIPSRVIEIIGNEAVVETGGVIRHVGIVLTPDVKAGDYVLVHAGYAISVIDAHEAMEQLNLISMLSEEYSE